MRYAKMHTLIRTSWKVSWNQLVRTGIIRTIMFILWCNYPWRWANVGILLLGGNLSGRCDFGFGGRHFGLDIKRVAYVVAWQFSLWVLCWHILLDSHVLHRWFVVFSPNTEFIKLKVQFDNIFILRSFVWNCMNVKTFFSVPIRYLYLP